MKKLLFILVLGCFWGGGSELWNALFHGKPVIVKVPANADPSQERQMLLAIANRPIDTNTTFTTGGDVSRFQRRTVPARNDPSAQLAQAMSGLGKGIGQAIAGGAGGASVPTGPVVRVARGNEVTVVPVGAR